MIASDKPASSKNEWHARFAGLAFACAQANRTEAADLLREGWRLLIDPPADWRGSINLTLDAFSLDAMLGAGAEDAAAFALLQDWAGFILSHGPGGDHMATVVIEGINGEASAEGDSAALALLGAAATALSGDDLVVTDHETLVLQSQLLTQRDPSLRLN